MANEMFGIGAYSAPEAARLLGINPLQLKRWVSGYTYKHKAARRSKPPLWSTQYEPDEDGYFLGFRDLIEARMVRELRKKNISLQTIRLCLARAREMVADSHPFSSRHFKTDGKTIFLEITRDLDEPTLIDLSQRQWVFRNVVAPSFTDLEFDDEAAIRWWPLHKKKTIVIDPARAFGQPIIASNGISTSRIVEAYEAEGRSIDRVAQLYEIAPSAIKDAIAFEDDLRHKKAA